MRPLVRPKMPRRRPLAAPPREAALELARRAVDPEFGLEGEHGALGLAYAALGAADAAVPRFAALLGR